MTKPAPREWFAVISKTRQEGTIARQDRSVQYEQNVEHLHLIEYAALHAAQAERDEWHSAFMREVAGLAAAEARVRELEQALEFYADIPCWPTGPIKNLNGEMIYPSGERARRALAPKAEG